MRREKSQIIDSSLWDEEDGGGDKRTEGKLLTQERFQYLERPLALWENIYKIYANYFFFNNTEPLKINHCKCLRKYFISDAFCLHVCLLVSEHNL